MATSLYPLLLVLAAPLALIILYGVADPAPGAALLALAVIGNAVPLWWRRRRPGLAFVAVTLTLLPAVLLVATRAVPPEYGRVLSGLLPVHLFALFSLAAWGRRPALTWLGIPVSVASNSLIGASQMARMGELTEDQAVRELLITFTLGVLSLLANPIFVWLAGLLVWRHRDRRRKGREQVEAALARAAELTRDERDRFAGGLRGAVLQHIAEVQSAAEREDLTAVVAWARSALAAMRVLLAGADRAGVPTSPAVGQPGEQLVPYGISNDLDGGVDRQSSRPVGVEGGPAADAVTGR